MALWKRGRGEGTDTRDYGFSRTASGERRMITLSQIHKDRGNLIFGQHLSNKIKFPLSTEIKLCPQQTFIVLETIAWVCKLQKPHWNIIFQYLCLETAVRSFQPVIPPLSNQISWMTIFHQ